MRGVIITKARASYCSYLTMRVTVVTFILFNLMEVFLSLNIGDLTLGTYPAHTLASGRQLLTSR